LKNILDYLGPGKAGLVVKGAKDDADALRKVKANADSFERPVVSFTSSNERFLPGLQGWC
jgi:hypothetical protein